MSKIHNAIAQIHELDDLSMQKTAIHRLHPLVKVLITLVYIISVISVPKYNLAGTLVWILYPAMVFYLSNIRVKGFLRKMRLIFPVILAIGIWNPFYDHSEVIHIGSLLITGGMVSMCTLMAKSMLALMASYLLVANTGIEKICYALTLLRVPNILVTQILLAYRYLILLMEEANAIFEAYSLRAPRQKGVKFQIWGPFIGQLLLRTIDRAGSLYEGMLLRGFQGEFYYSDRRKWNQLDVVYLCIWCFLFVLLHVAF